MTNFGDLGNYVNGFTCSPHEIESPKVSISPHLSPFVPKILGKSMKIDSVVCLGITLHHILVKFQHPKHNSRENYGEFWGQMVNYVNDFTPSPHDF